MNSGFLVQVAVKLYDESLEQYKEERICYKKQVLDTLFNGTDSSLSGPAKGKSLT